MGALNQSIPYEEYNTADILLLTGLVDGQIVFNTDVQNYWMYRGGGWLLVELSPADIPLYSEDFEGGVLPGDWVLVNNGVNDWIVGDNTAAEGTYSLYISDDGANAEYTANNSEVSHAYLDIAIPGGISNAMLQFDWKCEGELGYDYGRVYKSPITYTPVAGSLPGGASVQIGETEYNDSSLWTTETIELGNGDAGTTIRLIFTWRNDGSIGTNPGFCIDNIKVNYRL